MLGPGRPNSPRAAASGNSGATLTDAAPCASFRLPMSRQRRWLPMFQQRAAASCQLMRCRSTERPTRAPRRPPQIEKALPLCRTSDSRASAVPLSISSISRSCSSVENLAGTSLFCRCSRYRSSSCGGETSECQALKGVCCGQVCVSRVAGTSLFCRCSWYRSSCGQRHRYVVRVKGLLGARPQTSMGLVELNHIFHRTHRHGTGSAAAADKPGRRCRRQRWGSAHHSLVRTPLTSSFS